MEISFQFFEDIGAKVAKNKCFMISSSEKTKKNLRQRIFGKEGVQIQVINQFRDLGGDVCMDYSESAVTLNKRMERAIEQIQRLKWTKILKKRANFPLSRLTYFKLRYIGAKRLKLATK